MNEKPERYYSGTSILVRFMHQIQRCAITTAWKAVRVIFRLPLKGEVADGKPSTCNTSHVRVSRRLLWLRQKRPTLAALRVPVITPNYLRNKRRRGERAKYSELFPAER